MGSKIHQAYGKIAQFFSGKRLAAMAFVLLAVSLVPVLRLSGYDYAAGDDFGYGIWTHAAWVETGSLPEVFSAAGRTIRQFYYGWQGTWFSIFLFTLQPEVFSPDAYWIVPWLAVGLFVICLSLPLYEILVRGLGVSGSSFCLLDCLLVFLFLQFVPSTKSAIYWYNGVAHYVIPFSLALLCVYFAVRYARNGRLRELAALTVLFALLGGGNYQAALFAPMAVAMVVFLCRGRGRRLLLLAIPFTLEAVGLLVSITAPGNKVRGGKGFGLSVGRAAGTIGLCFVEGARRLGEYARQKPAACVLLLLLAVLTGEAILTARRTEFRFRRPLLFAAAMFCLYCAMFAPGLYAAVEVSGGVDNTIYLAFLLAFFASAVYTAGWWLNRGRETGRTRNPESYGKRVRLPAFLLCLLLLAAVRGAVRETTFFVCADYLGSGRAADYREQMERQRSVLLDPSVREAVVGPINDDQGPLMHMPVTDDENAWTNTVIRDFYGKDRVVMRPGPC